MGYVEDIKNFYNNCNLYVQPSATEGFGIEVFEAMAYARPVICSKGAGASSFISENKKFNARNSDELANKIDYYKNNPNIIEKESKENYDFAKKYYWGNVIRMYCDTWRELFK
jgi:glycosyltransferase involved in cell wall biosynthesis